MMATLPRATLTQLPATSVLSEFSNVPMRQMLWPIWHIGWPWFGNDGSPSRLRDCPFWLPPWIF
jgi:hypothetical protein